MDYTVKRFMSSGDDIVIRVGTEEIKAKNVFIGGFKDDGSEDIIACYGGVLDPAEMGLSLMHLHRATMRIMVNQLRMPLDKAEEFMLLCLAEAVRREEAQEREQGKQAIDKYLRDFLQKNQKFK